jgi:hypothetical protein
VKIDDREVPAAIVAHWKQALGGLPDVALSGVARAHTAIQAGFRPGKVPPAQVKQRAGALLDTLPGLPQSLHEALSAGGLQAELLCVLSEQALERHAGAWCSAFGTVPTSAAMLPYERQAEVDRLQDLPRTLAAVPKRPRLLLAQVRRARVDALVPPSQLPRLARCLQDRAAIRD